MRNTIRTVRSVAGNAQPFEFTPGLKVKDRQYAYGTDGEWSATARDERGRKMAAGKSGGG